MQWICYKSDICQWEVGISYGSECCKYRKFDYFPSFFGLCKIVKKKLMFCDKIEKLSIWSSFKIIAGGTNKTETEKEENI